MIAGTTQIDRLFLKHLGRFAPREKLKKTNGRLTSFY